eukprot:Hpha_TRINITY_DN16550_c0_g6::TRINITY_DN16550_c0_g6_i2::g.132675::m.132675/K09907/K09907; uncharacterized protein
MASDGELTLREVLGDYEGFIDCIVSNVERVGIPVQKEWVMDHLCRRVETDEEYEDVLRKLVPRFGVGLCEAAVQGRDITTVALHTPIRHAGFEVECIEVPRPKKGSNHPSGLEHAEFAVGGALEGDKSGVKRLEQFVEGLKDPGWVWHKHNEVNADVETSFEGTPFGKARIKFHVRTLSEVIKDELQEGIARPFSRDWMEKAGL